MSLEKRNVLSFVFFITTLFVSTTAFGQTPHQGTEFQPTIINEALYPEIYQYTFADNSGINHSEYILSTSAVVNNAERSRKTTSLAVGYIDDTYNLQSDDGSYRFRFNGESQGLMLSSKSSSLMLSYGVADAQENEGDIRSITADLNVGGNITLFRNFFGLPIGSYIPIRFNLGYRNLELMDIEDDATANIGTGSLGGGLGAEIRIPTGLPVLEDNITAFASLVGSVGAMGDFTGISDGFQSQNNTFGGVRLTRNTDLNIDAKFERLLGGKIGVTAGFTLRRLHWTDGEAEDFKQIFDVISGEQEDLKLRGTQSFFRVGINW
ncbi:hypothetical protein NC796_03950 [Aliifodinibius sp. S!AR15-10]|uniref:hypothetical protein n=1 Tax=Aliifodinibius sp. S!AR15-10 TaxID=2950437 RepID=UPI00285F8E5E|nr:hypothetical protein [Aliifodinibius sp. S!AR15-10]MDR8390280.1 hypothetical protein [Aliifodinibius sp. S!AR15-10]